MSNNSRFFFVLLSSSAALGIGNIWLFPYYSFKFSAVFFIQYLAALAILGVPLLMLEFSAAQYFNRNAVDLFASIRKWFSSIGWLLVFNAFIVMSCYAVILSWHMIYLFVSFGQQWKKDAKSYFFNNVLQASGGFHGFGQFSLPVFMALILAWVIIFFCIRKGFEGMKKYFLALFPVFISLLFLFFGYSLHLEKALTGIYAFIRPDFSLMLMPAAWTAAFSLSAASLGLSFGMMGAFARKSEGNFIAGASLIVAASKIIISIAAGFILFSMLGFLNFGENNAVELQDFSFTFAYLAQALPMFYRPALLSLLFFTFLGIFFVFGASALAYSISNVLVHKFKTSHRSAAVITSGFGFLFGMLFIIKPGVYILDIASHFIFYNIVIAALLEVIAVGWFSNSEDISDFINHGIALKIGRAWRWWIRYPAPLILVLLIIAHLRSDYLLNYNGYPFPAVLAFGAGIVAIPLIAAFLMPQKLLDRK